MYSVTSDLAASVSFQGAPSPRSGKTDPLPGNGSFAALVDGNKPIDTSPDRAPDPASRRFDDGSAAANSRRSQEAADQAARDASDDRTAVSQERADADAEDGAFRRSKTQASDAKSEAPKSTGKPPSDDASPKDKSADHANQSQPDAAAKTSDAVAAPIAVAAVAANVPAATSGNAASKETSKVTAPLALAAAAIAASVGVTDIPARASAQAVADPDAKVITAQNVKVAAQATGEPTATALIQPGTATDGSIAAAVTIAKPATAKTLAKAAATTPGAITASGPTDVTPDASGTATSAGIPATGADTQPATAGKPQVGDGLADAVKTDGAAVASPAANPLTHINPAHDATAPLLVALDAGVPTTGAMQPYLHSATTTTASAAALTATAATSDSVPLSGLAVEIAAKASAGNTHFEIRLDPADLGRIDVRIDVDRNGHVTSHLMIEKPETLSMLRQDAPQLQRALDDAGFRTGDTGLQFSLRDQNTSGQNNNDGGSGRHAQRLIVSEEVSTPALVAGHSYGRMLGSSSGVDIKV